MPRVKKPASPARSQIEPNEFGVYDIDNSALTAADLPSADAELTTVWDFALTFDGYRFWGSFEKCAEMANARRHASLTELRTCLFFEQRRWRQFEQDPSFEPDSDKEALAYIRKLVEQIRSRVVAGDVA